MDLWYLEGGGSVWTGSCRGASSPSDISPYINTCASTFPGEVTVQMIMSDTSDHHKS